MEFQTRLNTIEDAVKLVNKLEYYSCKAQLQVDDKVLDARSLMGLVEFGVGRRVRIVIRSEINDMIKTGLAPFEIA